MERDIPFHADNFLQSELNVDSVQRPIDPLAEFLAIKNTPIHGGFFRVNQKQHRLTSSSDLKGWGLDTSVIHFKMTLSYSTYSICHSYRTADN